MAANTRSRVRNLLLLKKDLERILNAHPRDVASIVQVRTRAAPEEGRIREQVEEDTSDVSCAIAIYLGRNLIRRMFRHCHLSVGKVPGGVGNQIIMEAKRNFSDVYVWVGVAFIQFWRVFL